MEDTNLTLPSAGKPVPAVNQAYQMASEKLSQIDDILELCRKSGAKCNNAGASKSVVVEYLHQPYVVSLRDAEISSDGNAAVLPIREKLLILHYLLSAKGSPPSGKLITFQELPEGHVYYPTFLKRSVQPLVSNFGSEPRLLLQPAEKLGAKAVELGDASVAITAFPRVPVIIVLWKGDEEFEAGGSILFDAGISDYLPTEDITILCETISW
ncbi:MAG: DUF3786 domain-containing protein, partial [Dehalococcoidales bacterium]|nr:DUF3786 domain-containing protein [Dehalococcoidales bacterium]